MGQMTHDIQTKYIIQIIACVTSHTDKLFNTVRHFRSERRK
jgi:hypothetical protein